jgi:type IV secretion/conjugal transfer VirB4 family ATPase
MRKAADFCSVLPYAGLVDDGIMVTKDAQLLTTIAIEPKDFAYSHDTDIFGSLGNLNNSFKYFGEGWTLYIDSIRRKRKPASSSFDSGAPECAKQFEKYHYDALGEFYFTDFFLTVCYSIAEKPSIGTYLFNTSSDDSIKIDIDNFKRITEDIFNMYGSVFRRVKRLDSSELLTYLHGLFSKHHPVNVPEIPFYLDYYLSDALFVPDSITRLNDEFVLTASVRDFPGETHSGMMTKLYKKNIEFRFSTRFIFLSREKSKREIKSFQSHHFNKRKGLRNIFSEIIFKQESPLEDTEATSLTSESSDALSFFATGDINFGYMTTAIIVQRKNYDTAKRDLDELKKIINECGFICKEETLNNSYVFLGSLPGNDHLNVRKNLISTRNLLHFFPLTDTWEGIYTNTHLKGLTGIDSPHITGKSFNSACYVNCNYGDAGFVLVLGPPGSGKSILINTLALQFFRYPGVRVFFFDKDRSSQYSCINCDVGSDDSKFFLNPFYRIHEKEHRVWFSEFIVEFLKSRGVSIGPADNNEIYSALETIGALPVEHRTFAEFQKIVQDENIRAGLSPFVDGEYSFLFKPECDDFSLNRFTVFEMSTIMRHSEDLVRFVLGYLFFKLQLIFDDKIPTLLILDEAWLFLDNEYFSSKLREYMKTLRKKNIYMCLSTQEVADAKSTIFSTILNTCMVKILLPNPQAGQSENMMLYKELGLNDGDIEAIVNAVPKRDYFYFSPYGKQMFDLCLDNKQLSILTSFTNKEGGQ